MVSLNLTIGSYRQECENISEQGQAIIVSPVSVERAGGLKIR